MGEPTTPELHQVAVRLGDSEPDTVVQLAHSPIGDDCQTCPVCRCAREYVERRLGEQAGRVFPPDQNSEAAWRKLQMAVEQTKTSVHKST